MHYLFPILAVLLGYAFILIAKPTDHYLKLILAFSGAFLLSVIGLHMLPQVYQHQNKEIGVFVLIGVVFQIILEFFSKGAEHGHISLAKKHTTFPWIVFLSLSIHAFLEGLPLYHHPHLVYAIFIHKFPVAVLLSLFFRDTKLPKSVIVIFLLLFAVMTPLGTLVQKHMMFIAPYSNEILALVIGILLHVSTTILFEMSENHKYNTSKLLVILAGFVTAYFI